MVCTETEKRVITERVTGDRKLSPIPYGYTAPNQHHRFPKIHFSTLKCAASTKGRNMLQRN